MEKKFQNIELVCTHYSDIVLNPAVTSVDRIELKKTIWMYSCLYFEPKNRKGTKKAEKLSQFVGPTSTYEKQPFWKGTIINSKAMPVCFFALYVQKNQLFV